MPISQNVTIRHFPLSLFSTNFPCHVSFQPSLTSLSDPPPYPRSVLPSSLGSTLQGNLLSSVYPQSTPAGSSFSFHQPILFSQPFPNLWSSHPIYHPQPIYATSHSFSSLSSSSLSNFSTNTYTTSSNTIPSFTTTSSISRPSPSGSSKRRPTGGWQRGWGRCNTYYSSRRPYSQTSASSTSSFANMDFSSSNPSWSGFSKYLCPDVPLNLSTRPRFANYSYGGTLVNPFLKSNSSQPKGLSPMVTFNEPSEHVRDMFSLVHSCDFLPGGNHKLTLSIHIKNKCHFLFFFKLLKVNSYSYV